MKRAKGQKLCPCGQPVRGARTRYCLPCKTATLRRHARAVDRRRDPVRKAAAGVKVGSKPRRKPSVYGYRTGGAS